MRESARVPTYYPCPTCGAASSFHLLGSSQRKGEHWLCTSGHAFKAAPVGVTLGRDEFLSRNHAANQAARAAQV